MRWTDPATLARQIQLLSDREFVELLNSLLSETAAGAGINRTCIVTNLNIQDPDGGIDARCVNASNIAGRLIPRRNVDYQFKAGQYKKSVSKIVSEDILDKPRLRSGLKDGHAIVFACGWERGDAVEDEITRELRKHVEVEDEQIVFLTASSIALLLQTCPGSLALFLGWDLPLNDFTRWTNFPSLRNEFQIDPVLKAMMESLRAKIETPKSVTHIIGHGGSGRTRLVMETLRTSVLAPQVLYARDATKVSGAFLLSLRRTPDVQCTVVVDDVERRDAETLNDEFADMPSGVRLVIIGLDGSNVFEATLRVPSLSEQLLSEIVRTILPDLPAETALAIASGCDGLPRLAIERAQRVKEQAHQAGDETLTPESLRYVDFGEPVTRSGPTANYDLVKPCLFDLSTVVDQSLDAIFRERKGLIGLVLCSRSYVLLKQCCDRLELELRAERVRVLPPWGIPPTHRTVEEAVNRVLKQKNVLNYQDVLMPVQIPDRESARQFWISLPRNMFTNIQRQLIILMAVGEECSDLDGVVYLETPAFDKGHAYRWIRDVVLAMRWPGDFIEVWRQSMLDELPKTTSLEPELVYLHLEETTNFIRKDSRLGAFRAELRRRGQIYGAT